MAKRRRATGGTGEEGGNRNTTEPHGRPKEAHLKDLLPVEVRDRLAGEYGELLRGRENDRAQLIRLAIRCAWRVCGLIVESPGDDPDEVRRTQEVVREILQSALDVCTADPRFQDVSRKHNIDGLVVRLTTIKIDAPQDTPINKAATSAERLTQVVSRCYLVEGGDYAIKSAQWGLLAAVEAALLVEGKPFDQSAGAKLVHDAHMRDLKALAACGQALDPFGALWTDSAPGWAEVSAKFWRPTLARLTMPESGGQTREVRHEQSQPLEPEARLPARQIEAIDIHTLRAKMRYAKQLSGLTNREVGERMGYAATSAGGSINLLLTDNMNPGVLTLDRFARAVGLSLVELLSLPEPARSEES